MRYFISFFLIFFNFIILDSFRNCFAFDLPAKEAFLMDYDTNEVLFSKNGSDKVAPSSMTKIMTAYLIFEKIQNGQIKLSDEFYVSENAWRQEGSRMFLKVNTKVTVEELLQGLVVQSGNDAAVALAEGSSGNVDNFVKAMNIKAKEFGMKNTNFTNPIGMPDENHYMSVQDTAILSEKLIKDFPEYYKRYFAEPEYTYNNIKQPNRNGLLGKYDGVDGIKTGHTDVGGYSMVNSAIRDNRRLISVINGVESEKERIEQARNLLDYGFYGLKKIQFYKSGDFISEVPVLYGKSNAKIIVENDIFATTEDKSQVQIATDINTKLKAPIAKNTVIGKIRLKSLDNEMEYNLYVQDEVKEVNIFVKFFIFLKNLFAL